MVSREGFPGAAESSFCFAARMMLQCLYVPGQDTLSMFVQTDGSLVTVFGRACPTKNGRACVRKGAENWKWYLQMQCCFFSFCHPKPEILVSQEKSLLESG